MYAMPPAVPGVLCLLLQRRRRHVAWPGRRLRQAQGQGQQVRVPGACASAAGQVTGAAAVQRQPCLAL